MSTSSEPDFTQLKRLLALKRHEQPPPGYFDFLAGRIQAELRTASAARRPRQEPNGLVHRFFALLESFQARPAFAVGVGAVVCALVLSAMVMSEEPNHVVLPAPSLLTEVTRQPEMDAPIQPVALEMSPMLASNTPAAGAPNLFDLFQPPSPMPAGFTNP